MAGHHAPRLQRLDPVEHRHPGLARGLGLGIGGPDVRTGFHQHATNHRLQRRNPQHRAVRARPLQVDHLQGMAFQLQLVALQRLRHHQRRRRVVLEDRPPVGQLGVLGRLDVCDGLRRREDLRLGEGGLQHVEAEVEVRVAVADVDSAEGLAAGLDTLDQLLGVGAGELRVDQHRLALAHQQFRGHGEDRLLAGVVDLQPQRFGAGGEDAGGTQQGGGGEQGTKQSMARHERFSRQWDQRLAMLVA